MKLISYEYTRQFLRNSYLRPFDYNIEELIAEISKRKRFSEVTRFIEGIRSLDNDFFSQTYTNHYFIHCKTLNDGLIAAAAICGVIFRKYSYSIGEYLVKRSGEASFSDTGFTADKAFADRIPRIARLCEQKADYCTEIFSNMDNPSVFLYEESDINEIFMYDPEGIKVCFVIRADNAEGAGDCIVPLNNTAVQYVRSASLTPVQAAAELHYNYIEIPGDSADCKYNYMKKVFEKKGFIYSGVINKMKSLANHPAVSDEYTAESAAKAVINSHLTSSCSSRFLCCSDFADYFPEEKAVSDSLKSKKKGAFANCLIGLDTELEILSGAISLLRLDIERKNRDLTKSAAGCSMVFAGPPGTAKTTLAREFGRLLCENGIIPSQDNFRECRKSDIVGMYVGHTAARIDNLFSELSSSGGGVIFFDEIYTLSEDNNTSFDTEAINSITQNMENFRSNVFCIFAGYESKMKGFLESNPGLASRITTTVRFSSYDEETLVKIFEAITIDANFCVAEDIGEMLKVFFAKLRTIRGESFGNGREARNLFENAKRVMAIRLSGRKRPTRKELMTITAGDIEKAAEEILGSVTDDRNKTTVRIGF